MGISGGEAASSALAQTLWGGKSSIDSLKSQTPDYLRVIAIEAITGR